MKTTILIILLCWGSVCGFAQKNTAIFLHHSTGDGVYSEGNVADWVSNYNSTHGTNFQIIPRTYPDTPYPWANYPYDYWKLWVNNNCDNSNLNIECLASIAGKCGLVIYKHCYPGASINADIGNPDVTSSRQSLENYKLQYRDLRSLMDGMPDKKFMVWTLVPLHRLATNAAEANRAHEFVEWVKNEWLTEDDQNHPNIFIFDFYSLAAELNPNPVNGQQYCLKYEYEGSHTSYDSHPNILANQNIGPLFAQAVVDVLAKNYSVTNISVSSLSGVSAISTFHGTLQLQASILPTDALSKSVTWSVINLTGKASVNSSGLLSAETNGTVKVLATATDGSGIKGELQITITNQLISVESITIIDNLPNDTIPGIGIKLELKASLTPTNATNPTVDWIVENITGTANIDNNGLLVTTSPGKIKVIAKALDGSSTIAQKEYLIAIPVFSRQEMNDQLIHLFPNPTANEFRIEISQIPIEGLQIEIRDVRGQLMLMKQIFDQSSIWSFAKFNDGIYFVTVKDNKNIWTKKMVKYSTIK